MRCRVLGRMLSVLLVLFSASGSVAGPRVFLDVPSRLEGDQAVTVEVKATDLTGLEHIVFDVGFTDPAFEFLNAHLAPTFGRNERVASFVERGRGSIRIGLVLGSPRRVCPDTLALYSLTFMVNDPKVAPIVTSLESYEGFEGEIPSRAPAQPAIQEDQADAVEGPSLRPNRPNPFNPETTIAFDLATAGRVSIRVFDITGRLVRDLIPQEEYRRGTHVVSWDGRDGQGRQVPAGIYFYRIEAGEWSETRKMVVVR